MSPLPRLPLLVLAFALLGCSSFGSGAGDGGAGDGGANTTGPGAGGPSGGTNGGSPRVCLDASGQPTESCAVPIVPVACDPAAGAGQCATLVKEELRAGTMDSGPCLRLVIRNDCDATMYSQTCIEHTNDRGPPSSQCWTSTTLRGSSVDVGQCKATGRYLRISTVSKGELDVLESQCPPPK